MSAVESEGVSDRLDFKARYTSAVKAEGVLRTALNFGARYVGAVEVKVPPVD